MSNHARERRIIGQTLGYSALASLVLAACGADTQPPAQRTNAIIDRSATPLRMQDIQTVDQMMPLLGVTDNSSRNEIIASAVDKTYRHPPNLVGTVFSYRNDAGDPIYQVLNPGTDMFPAGEIALVSAEGNPIKVTTVNYKTPEKYTHSTIALPNSCQIVILGNETHVQSIVDTIDPSANTPVGVSLAEFVKHYFEPKHLPFAAWNTIIFNFLPSSYPFPINDLIKAGASRRLQGKFLFQTDVEFNRRNHLNNSVLLNFSAIHGFSNATGLSLDQALTMTWANNFMNMAAINNLSYAETKVFKTTDETFSTIAGITAARNDRFAQTVFGTDAYKLLNAYLAGQMRISLAS